ncbi:MAG: hypothetical protein K0Q55_2007 [Verrucomicrobia bacterium]|jgi:hypothetical protein|nr:hypothetical protein [Verrucomicrobiota bacterium]
MSRVQAIKAFFRRREIGLVLGGLLLVGITYKYYYGLNRLGKVSLEFVGYEARRTNVVDGSIMAFRLINQSGGDISYMGFSDVAPYCDVNGVLKDGEYSVLGGPLTDPRLRNVTYVWPRQYYVVKNGEERIVYAEVHQAEQSWVMSMKYWEGREIHPPGWLPSVLREWLQRDISQFSENTVLSEPVHRLIPPFRSSYVDLSDLHYFITNRQTNSSGRVTGKVEAGRRN